MNDLRKHPLAMDGKEPTNLRGDPITQERYYCREFMQRERDHLWTRIWHSAGRVQQLDQPGAYITHDFMHESVIIVKLADGSLQGFCNAFGASSDNFGLFRWEPHATDPEKCYFDLWSMAYPVQGKHAYVHRTASRPAGADKPR